MMTNITLRTIIYSSRASSVSLTEVFDDGSSLPEPWKTCEAQGGCSRHHSSGGPADALWRDLVAESGRLRPSGAAN